MLGCVCDNPATLPTSHAADVARLLDDGRWTGYQRWLVFLSALAVVFDGIDNQLIGVAVPAIMKDWGLTRSAFAPVVSLGYVGMMAGGALAGLAGDRIGRRTALVACVLLFGVTTVAVLGVHSVAALAALRCLAGVGLGGAIPNATTLSAEYVSLKHRPLAVTLTIICVPVGGILVGLIAVPVLPTAGWRMLFFICGGLPIVGAAALRYLMPESPRFLAHHPNRHGELRATLGRMGVAVPADATFVDGGASAHGKRPTIGALFTPELRGDTMALWMAYFSCLLAVYLAFSWVPSMLAGAGFGPSVASSGITAFNLGGVAGALFGGWVITRFGSRAWLLPTAVLAGISAGLMSLMPLNAGTTVFTVIAMLSVVGALVNGVQTAMYPLAAEVYPAAIRATGMGSALAFGRSGAVLSGYVGAWALEYRGSTAFFAIMGLAMIVSAVSLSLIRRHTPVR